MGRYLWFPAQQSLTKNTLLCHNTSHATINTSLLCGGHMFIMAEVTATVEVGEKEREGEGQVFSRKGRQCVSGLDPRQRIVKMIFTLRFLRSENGSGLLNKKRFVKAGFQG